MGLINGMIVFVGLDQLFEFFIILISHSSIQLCHFASLSYRPFASFRYGHKLLKVQTISECRVEFYCDVCCVAVGSEQLTTLRFSAGMFV